MPVMSGSVVLVLMLLSLTGQWSVVVSYGNGAPNNHDACIDMFPSGHGPPPQDTRPPFTITVSEDYYNPDQEIQVTVGSSDVPPQPFKGFLIQARLAFPDINNATADVTADVIGAEQAFGRFTLDEQGLSKHTCASYQDEESTLTHTSSVEKDSVTFTWTAPSQYVGHLQFRATVVLVQETYWMEIVSVILSDPTVTPFQPRRHL